MAIKATDRWLARSFHLFLTGMVLLIVFLKDTDFKQALYNGHLTYVAFYLALNVLATVLYLITTFMDPGYVSYSSIDAETGVVFNTNNDESEILTVHNDLDASETSSMLQQDARQLRFRRCGFCEIIQPLRTKHCEECNRCVRRYDHHCPWIGSCVGERNHKFFLSFLAAETCVVSWSVYVTVRAFQRETVWKVWFEHNWMYLVLTVFLAATLLIVGLLWMCHTYMMFTAQTTWEFMSRPRISYLKKFPVDYNPFDRDIQIFPIFNMNFLSHKYRLFIHKDGQYILKPVLTQPRCDQKTNMDKGLRAGGDVSRRCRKFERRRLIYVTSCSLCGNRYATINRLFQHLALRHHRFERKNNKPSPSPQCTPPVCSSLPNHVNVSVNCSTNQVTNPISHVSAKSDHTENNGGQKNYRKARKSPTPTKIHYCGSSVDLLSEYRLEHTLLEHTPTKLDVRQLQIHCGIHDNLSMLSHVVSKQLLTNETKNLFSCTQCNYKCANEKALASHVTEEHDWKKLYTCTVCSQKFAATTKYKQHCLTAHNITRPFKCDQCDYRFPNESSLKVHYRSHNNERPYKCQICGAAFSQSSTLSNHLKRHTGDTPHQCEICGKSFAIKGDLRTHHRIHRSDKPFSCETCGKTFPRRSNYVRHLRKHTGEKPYQCQYCEKRFARSEKCVEHQRTHTNERPFVCTECDATFADSGNFSKHKKLHKQGKIIRRKKAGHQVAKAPAASGCVGENDSNTSQHLPVNEKLASNRPVVTKQDDSIAAVKPIIISLVHPPINSKAVAMASVNRILPGEGLAAQPNHSSGQYFTFATDNLKSSEGGQFIALLNDEQVFNTSETKLVNMIKRDDYVEPVLVNADNLSSMPLQHNDIESNSLNNHYFMLDYLSRDSGLSFVSDGHLLVKNASVFLQPPQADLPHSDNSLYGVSGLDADLSARELNDSVFSQDVTPGLTSLSSYSHISLDVNPDSGLFGRVGMRG